MIAAGIVTFEPEISRLTDNIRALASQVSRVAVFDNCSSNVEEIASLVAGSPNAILITSPSNLGIAGALNRLAVWATHEGFDWLVTLDQDSVASAGMVEELYAVARDYDAALVAPYIVDRNKASDWERQAQSLPRAHAYRQAARKGAITSGSLTALGPLFQVGGFDERLFIDYVDYDLNQRLLLGGFNIVRANRTHLLHEVGRAAPTWLWVPRRSMSGHWQIERFYSFGHSPQRCYFKARNRVIFTRKYGRQIGISHEGIWQIPQQILLTVAFESDRWRKLMSFVRGIRDGIRMRLSD